MLLLVFGLPFCVLIVTVVDTLLIKNPRFLGDPRQITTAQQRVSVPSLGDSTLRSSGPPW